MKSLIKIRDMLCLIAAEPAIGLSSLSKKLSMPKSTAHRILRALEASGFVLETEQDHRYELGPLIRDLANGHTRRERLIRIARPLMMQLRDKCRETVALHVLEAKSWIVIDQVESPQELRRTITNMNVPLPLHAAATGKLFLANLSERERDHYFKENELRPFTRKTPVNRQNLEKELAQIRLNGYAVSFGEVIPDIAGLSMPIRSDNGAVGAAIGVSGPIVRFTPKAISAMRVALKEVVLQVTRQLNKD